MKEARRHKGTKAARGSGCTALIAFVPWCLGAFLWLFLLAPSARAQDDPLDDIKQLAQPATAPAGDIAPDTEGPSDPLGTKKLKAPNEARAGTVTLSSGKIYNGSIWTTLATPLRIWVEAEKRYNDLDWNLIKSIDVDVEYARMEDDWRWLKEGSDKKIYSGQKYPNVSLKYKFELVNGQKIEGTVTAPIYILDDVGTKPHAYALYKKFKGKMNQTMDDVIYIKSIHLAGNGSVAVNRNLTTKLPLIMD
jgi:hypothetical protein